jgi:hypothetical protein
MDLCLSRRWLYKVRHSCFNALRFGEKPTFRKNTPPTTWGPMSKLNWICWFSSQFNFRWYIPPRGQILQNPRHYNPKDRNLQDPCCSFWYLNCLPFSFPLAIYYTEHLMGLIIVSNAGKFFRYPNWKHFLALGSNTPKFDIIFVSHFHEYYLFIYLMSLYPLQLFCIECEIISLWLWLNNILSVVWIHPFYSSQLSFLTLLFRSHEW